MRFGRDSLVSPAPVGPVGGRVGPIDRADAEPDVMDRRAAHRAPEGGQECGFLERRQLGEQRRVGDRDAQDAPAEAFDPGLTPPGLADGVGPGRLQLAHGPDPRQAPRGEQVAQDVRDRLRPPGPPPRGRAPRRGSSRRAVTVAVVGLAIQSRTSFIIAIPPYDGYR